MSDTKTATRRAAATGKSANVWTDEERAAMQESARERKKSGKLSPDEERAQGEADVRAKIAEMPEPDRSMAERLHTLVTSTSPSLVPRTYYGMPAYAKDGKVICFFQAASKFKVRYATFGFQPDAKLDDGTMWPTSFALTELSSADERRIRELVQRASS
jgi:uncharacterized protein YdhG (YjbR/CyaY superfamily)